MPRHRKVGGVLFCSENFCESSQQDFHMIPMINLTHDSLQKATKILVDFWRPWRGPTSGACKSLQKKPPYGQFPATSFRWLTGVAYVSRLWDLRCNLRNFTQAGRLFVPGRLGDGWTAGWQIFRWSAPSEVLIVLVDMIRLPLSWKPSCPHSWKLDICAVGTPNLDSSIFFGPNFPISNFDIFDSRHSRLASRRLPSLEPALWTRGLLLNEGFTSQARVEIRSQKSPNR
jgi:hypothetical protein